MARNRLNLAWPLRPPGEPKHEFETSDRASANEPAWTDWKSRGTADGLCRNFDRIDRRVGTARDFVAVIDFGHADGVHCFIWNERDLRCKHVTMTASRVEGEIVDGWPIWLTGNRVFIV